MALQTGRRGVVAERGGGAVALVDEAEFTVRRVVLELGKLNSIRPFHALKEPRAGVIAIIDAIVIHRVGQRHKVAGQVIVVAGGVDGGVAGKCLGHAERPAHFVVFIGGDGHARVRDGVQPACAVGDGRMVIGVCDRIGLGGISACGDSVQGVVIEGELTSLASVWVFRLPFAS